MRVAIDATPILAVNGRTGIGVVTSEILERIARRDDVSLVAYAKTGRRPRALAHLALPGCVGRVPWWKWMPAGPLGGLWRKHDWPTVEFWAGKVDVVHGTNTVVPPAARAGRVVTVHDLAPLRVPDTVLPPHRRDPELIDRAIRSGAFVHTLSEFVRAEVIDQFHADPTRVVAVPPGPPRRSTATAADGHKLAESDNYILALGTLHPRKNLLTLLTAFEALAKDDHENDLVLVMAGALSPNGQDIMAAVRQSPMADRIRCSGLWVDDSAKNALISGAKVLAYPSRYEGFGLPLLEAMQAGIPVVTSSSGALVEVAGKAALFVDPSSVDELVDAIRRLLHDQILRQRLIDAGRVNLDRFSWQKFEADLIMLYRNAAMA